MASKASKVAELVAGCGIVPSGRAMDEICRAVEAGAGLIVVDAERDEVRVFEDVNAPGALMVAPGESMGMAIVIRP